MPDPSQPIVVVGATGHQGGAVVRCLLARGYAVRAFVRDPAAPGARAVQAAGAELAVGDLDAAESVRSALTGARGVFLALSMMDGARISPELVVAERRRGETIAELVARTGVGHLVYSSISGVDADSGIPYYESKAHIEAHIRELSLPATILRPVSFMDNFRTFNRPARDSDGLVLNLAVPAEQPMQLIAVDDIGAFATIAFDQPEQFVGRTLEIAGDRLTPTEIAKTFGQASGQPARHQQTTIAQVHAFDPQLAQMFAFFNERPLPPVDLTAMRAIHPGLATFETWVRTVARSLFASEVGDA